MVRAFWKCRSGERGGQEAGHMPLGLTGGLATWPRGPRSGGRAGKVPACILDRNWPYNRYNNPFDFPPLSGIMLRFLEGIPMSKGSSTKKDTCLVQCRLEPGMFKEEWLVFLDAVDPESQQERQVQLFADVREVTRIHGTPRRNQPAPGYLRVSLVKAKNGFVQVVLPQPAMPFG